MQSEFDQYKSFLLQREELSKTNKIAPWLDYLGNPIFENDLIQHPSGEIGLVIFLQSEYEPYNQWRVKYNDNVLSRLYLQIGDKGQAIVVGHPLEHIEVIQTVVP
ncbi:MULTISPECIES: hypothetical protein [Acinetobacter]|uniref:hypothetical protein n=1 Tax=Acinetobacter TaxID=469 RepID=UPI0009A66F96|nr:hypothetical protein [Acinetobacter baumannii]